MHIPDSTFALPLGATPIDLQYRLPAFQQILFSPTIAVSLVLLGLALVAVIVLSYRAKMRAKQEARREALKLAEKILTKRGGSHDDVEKVLYVFRSKPGIDAASAVMVHDRFTADFLPILTEYYDKEFAKRIELFYFPPPKDTRKLIRAKTEQELSVLVEEAKTGKSTTAAAILDLMDATLKPGVVTKLTFHGIEGGYDCMVMGHDMQHINVTLPANNNVLLSSIRPGMEVEGSLESGPSLMAYTAAVVRAVAGSMPYCRLTAWKSAWEVRKRESVRLPIVLEVDFQHISTSSSDSISMSNIDKELGTIRPGRLVDISLGGCCLETPSAGQFLVGDMVRFSKSLVAGNPPATLLGAIVNVDQIDPNENGGSRQRLHVQFLILDDVSQRILVRAMRQLQDVMAREEWMKAQQLLQKMRHNKIENIGSPVTGMGAPARLGGTTKAAAKRPTTRVGSKSGTRSGGAATGAKESARATRPGAASQRAPLRGPTQADPRPATQATPKGPTQAAPRPPTRQAQAQPTRPTRPLPSPSTRHPIPPPPSPPRASTRQIPPEQ